MNKPFLIDLGVEVKSSISGFKGIVTSRAEHVNGCNRYWIAPKVGKDGKMLEGTWLDEAELIVTSKPKVERKNNDRGGFPSKIK